MAEERGLRVPSHNAAKSPITLSKDPSNCLSGSSEAPQEGAARRLGRWLNAVECREQPSSVGMVSPEVNRAQWCVPRENSLPESQLAPFLQPTLAARHPKLRVVLPALPRPQPCLAERSARAAQQAAELAFWEATGGDFLRSSLAADFIRS